ALRWRQRTASSPRPRERFTPPSFRGVSEESAVRDGILLHPAPRWGKAGSGGGPGPRKSLPGRRTGSLSMRYPLAAPHTSPPATAPHASLRPPAGGASTGAATRGRVRWWVLVLTCPLIAVDNLWVVWMERVER